MQNHEEPESVCPDILNELGADYFRNDEIQMKKYKKNKEDRNAIYRSLNKRQKEIFYDMGEAGTGKSRLLNAISVQLAMPSRIP